MARASTRLTWRDHLGAWKVRWGIGRMSYRVAPGMYAVGGPGPDSPVLVSANFKMSFDALRSRLTGIDAWILVLDTGGVCVWCSAGKGTFGTEELVRRIEQHHLPQSVSHRTVILPQLAAPGVAAHEVAARTGMRVAFGPVRAADLPAYLSAGGKALPDMRRVHFPLRERLALIPVEVVTTAKWILPVAGLLLAAAGLGPNGYAGNRVWEIGVPAATFFLTGCVAALVLGPTLLPWLPGRPFSLKGFWIGLAAVLIFFGWAGRQHPAVGGPADVLAWCLLLPAAASLLVLKFTGCATFTSLSGARREIRAALPLQLAGIFLGIGLWIAGRFL